jgi:hypothetical protein
VRRQKALISRWEELSLAGGIEAGIEAFGECFDGDATEPGRMMGEFFREKERSKARIEARDKVASSKGEEGL